MQIPSKPVVQAYDDFEILMRTSKGEHVNSKFLVFLFTCWLLSQKFVQQQVQEIFTANL